MSLFKRTILLSALLPFLLQGVYAEEENNDREVEPVQGVLFPWFVQVLGIMIFFLLSRYASWMPYTAILFLTGTIIGIGVTRLGNVNQLSDSIVGFWIPIDSEVLLLIFLPGLVFKDASSLNVHLLRVSFWQVINFAFPLVLAGTCLTALVVWGIFPYDWSWNFAMTMGAILSATDPVAVSALLDAVGAPPRLKMHISGESLVNDGSAIVFFTIFSDMFFLELGEEGLGQDYDGASGTAKFFRMSMGALAIGIFFGLGLVSLLYFLNRRLSREENVVQVASTISIAYLCYYTADVVWGTSGVIATLTCGVLTQILGQGLISDLQLLTDFWSLVEHLLNTLLFALGGLVWGSVICNGDERGATFDSKDWGYLFLLYTLLTVIRFFLFFAVYPITAKTGLGTCWQECVFQSYGGLRGAVGISLAIVLDNTVRSNTLEGSDFRIQTTKSFGFIGGVAFLTLMINATTAGPLLRKLGLADTLPVREHILGIYKRKWRKHVIAKMVELLAQARFSNVKFPVIQQHVTVLKDLTEQEFLDATESYRQANGNRLDYTEPNVSNILPYLEGPNKDKAIKDAPLGASGGELEKKIDLDKDTPTAKQAPPELEAQTGLEVEHAKSGESFTGAELRRIFLQVLQQSYSQQMEFGELYSSDFIAFSLDQSLEFARDDVQNGKPLNDWHYISLVKVPATKQLSSLQNNKFLGFVKCCITQKDINDYEHLVLKYDVERCLSFLRAHKHSQSVFIDNFPGGELSKELDEVIAESEAECQKALELMQSYPTEKVDMVVSHRFCTILLNDTAWYITKLNEKGLMKDQEAEESMEKLQAELNRVSTCTLTEHPGE